MEKQRLNRDLLILAILTVITVFTWIGFEVYRTLTETEIPSVLQHQIEPLNPTIEKAVLQSLKSRKSFSPEELVTAPILTKESAEEESLPATESGETEEATPSAE
jgi:hypothetical protein